MYTRKNKTRRKHQLKSKQRKTLHKKGGKLRGLIGDYYLAKAIKRNFFPSEEDKKRNLFFYKNNPPASSPPAA